ncbi:type II toxin-antitoxin system HipA family toxin [Thalassospira sp. TSL5-1]|uniref:type II toxin-antitoxin system HipA family toxin n=1 Tax=Thalassospira sp. TSL5-1 TaxID=1544451 RepID=UPI00093EA01E|nr:type II toxin-antitoxin system HipA family toxin [Thalassospira sp. TSL5-1]
MARVAFVCLYDKVMGELAAGNDGRLQFRYNADFIARHHAGDVHCHPLSLSLPVPDHYSENFWFDDQQCGPFFAGLLPDNKQTRRRLAQILGNRHAINANDEFAMLFALGRDCPGAVSLIASDADPDDYDPYHPQYRILSKAELARHIRELPTRPLFADDAGEIRISLAGVHDKAVVIRVGGDIALPLGRTPSSHILKPDIRGLPGSIRVEHFCLEVARALGLATPRSHIMQAEEQTFMLLARYDRALHEKSGTRYLTRLHQEDFCQATGHFPDQKYERDGGPGWHSLFAMLRYSHDPAHDRRELLRRAIFQYLIGNPDAHAKNYSLLWRNGTLRLAPLYDINNAKAFAGFYKQQRIKLAMAIGGERNPAALTKDHWTQFAKETGLGPQLVLSELDTLRRQIGPAAQEVRNRLANSQADTQLLDLALEDILSRCP